jgi:hypothetical protein
MTQRYVTCIALPDTEFVEVAEGTCTSIILWLHLLLAHSMFTDEELAEFLHLCGRGLCLIATANRRHISYSVLPNENAAAS